jgi:hypothetical protein
VTASPCTEECGRKKTPFYGWSGLPYNVKLRVYAESKMSHRFTKDSAVAVRDQAVVHLLVVWPASKDLQLPSILADKDEAESDTEKGMHLGLRSNKMSQSFRSALLLACAESAPMHFQTAKTASIYPGFSGT